MENPDASLAFGIPNPRGAWSAAPCTSYKLWRCITDRRPPGPSAGSRGPLLWEEQSWAEQESATE